MNYGLNAGYHETLDCKDTAPPPLPPWLRGFLVTAKHKTKMRLAGSEVERLLNDASFPHRALYARAEAFLEAHTHTVASFEEMVELFGSGEPAWARVSWSRPTGKALDDVVKRLKEHQLTVRVAPFDQGEIAETCIFTGETAVETIVVAKAY